MSEVLVSGFTMLRNGVQYDYPFIESIRSLLPLVDELVVVVGLGTDDTLTQIKFLAAENPKIVVKESVWDEKMRKEGLILSEQTTLAMSYCRGKWGIYLQADEVLHEEDYPKIRAALDEAKNREDIDGLLFDYVHFYGDFFVVNRNPSAYRHEVRAVRLDRGVVSWKDAQGFRREVNGRFEKLRVLHCGARIFHYGWVRPPEVMKEKTVAMDKLYHAEGSAGTGDNYIYKRIYGLERFTDSHPATMKERIEQKRWKVDLMAQPMIFRPEDVRKVISRWIERLTGWLPGQYKNYRRVS
ncbi:MAG: glycosyltransferase family 2 protein [Bacteriovoracia bacterium]